MNDDNQEKQDILINADDELSEKLARREYQLMAASREEVSILSDYLQYLWMIYADFQLMIVSPFVDTLEPPVLIPPEYDKENKIYENVYPIMDHGYAFRTSRGEEMVLGTTAMGKLYNTIHKIIQLVMKRLKEGSGGEEKMNPDTEIKLALFGYELGKRKAFALSMDLEENVNIVNFDPRVWGERFIANLKNMIASGKGYPKDLKRVSERVSPGATV
jgi:hypothetical protein